MNNSTPEDYLLPIEEAAKLGNPADAINCCLNRLASTIELFSESTTGAADLDWTDLGGFSWSLPGQVATIKYLHKVQEEFAKPDGQAKKT